MAAVEVNRAGACATRNETRAAASARAGVRFVCFFFRWADFVWLLVSIRALGHALIDTHADTERHTHTLPRCRTSLSLARVCQSRAALAARQSLVEGEKKGRSGLALTSLRACHRTLSLVEDCIFRVATTAARATGLAGRGVRFVWSFFLVFVTNRQRPVAGCCSCRSLFAVVVVVVSTGSARTKKNNQDRIGNVDCATVRATHTHSHTPHTTHTH